VARLAVRRGPLRTQFTTRNRLDPGRSVHMQLVEGPFKVLEGSWNFTPVASNGCRIEFKLRFQFSNTLKSALFEPLFEEAQAELVRAFVARAQSLPA
jgi:ribosome-associated toxin RatA of RatAB toxin-antitoxin module